VPAPCLLRRAYRGGSSPLPMSGTNHGAVCLQFAWPGQMTRHAHWLTTLEPRLLVPFPRSGFPRSPGQRRLRRATARPFPTIRTYLIDEGWCDGQQRMKADQFSMTSLEMASGTAGRLGERGAIAWYKYTARAYAFLFLRAGAGGRPGVGTNCTPTPTKVRSPVAGRAWGTFGQLQWASQDHSKFNPGFSQIS
jgi:hypothetical protein